MLRLPDNLDAKVIITKISITTIIFACTCFHNICFYVPLSPHVGGVWQEIAWQTNRSSSTDNCC